MTTTPERHQSAAQELAQVKAEATSQSSAQIVDGVLQLVVKAAEVKQAVDASVNHEHKAPDRFEGHPRDEDTMKGKATEVMKTVQKVLFTPSLNKELTPVGTSITPEVVTSSNEVIKALSNNITSAEVTETSAPYLYHIIHRSLTGQLRNSEDLVIELNNISHLAEASPELYRRVQKAFVDYAVQVESMAENVAMAKFHYQENQAAADQSQNRRDNQRRNQGDILNSDDERRLGDLLNRVRARSKTMAAGEELVKSLSITGMISEPTMRERLQALNFKVGEIEDLISLSTTNREGRISLDGVIDKRNSRLAEYDCLTPELVRLFSIDGVKDYLEDEKRPDGTLTGYKKISDLGRRVLKKQALYTLNRLMSKVDNNPDTDFHTNFSDLREGYAYFELQTMVETFQRNIVNNKDLQQALGAKNARELDYFINKGVVQELAREKSLRELFHTLGIYIKTLPPEKIAEFVSRYNLSDIDSVVTSDFSGKIISLAMSEYERYLQFDRTKNKGQLRTSLFAGKSHLDMMYKDNDDRTCLRERLRETLVGLQVYMRQGGLNEHQRNTITKGSQIQTYDLDNIEGFEEWELDRALKYAQGIQLTQTIRGFEVIASGRPPDHFRGSADNMIDMAGVLNPHWRWQLGRGGKRKMPRYRELLSAELIVKRPEMNLVKRIFGDRWDPKGLHEKFKGGQWYEDEWEKQWETIEDKWLYKDVSFKKMLKLLGMGGLAGRFGWRGTGFAQGNDGATSEFQEYASSIQTAIEGAVAELTGSEFAFAKDGKRWVETYDQLAKSVGVGSRFFFDTDRAKDFAKTELWKQLKIDPTSLPSRELDRLWDEYTYGKYGNNEVIKLPGGERATAMELMEIKTLMFRGLNFQALLERAPLDFLNSIVNITPELLTEKLGGTSDVYFEFDEGRLRAEIARQQPTHGGQEELFKKVKTKQIEMRRMWGESNYENLHRVRSFYKQIEAWGEAQVDCKNAKGTMDKEKVWEKLYRTMDLATEKVKLRNAPTMSPSDIADPQLREIFLGAGGLVTHFKGLNENFGADAALGEKGFFYHMGRAWYNELGHQFPPDTTDVDWRFILHNMGANSGENMVTRLWKDLNAFNGVMGKLMGLDDLLAKCARSKNLEELYKLHGEIRGLKGIAGDEACYEMNFYIAQIAARYFKEHHLTRMPFLLGGMYHLINGKDLSLSRIYGGKDAMSLSTDGLNAYFQMLVQDDFIMEEGIYGFERLAKSMGADWDKLVVSEIIPNVATALALFMLWKFIKDGLEETTTGGQQKK